MITLPEEIQTALDSGWTLVVPDRQRAFGVRRAHGLTHAMRGERAWPSPDVLPFDAWQLREIERLVEQGAELPRVLSGVEEGWLWRRLALDASPELPNAAALGQAARRADRLALDHGIDVAGWAGCGTRETDWFLARQREFRALERELQAAPLGRIAAIAGITGDAKPLLFALDPAASARARALHERRLARALPSAWYVPAAPGHVEETLIELPTQREEDEEIIAWCGAQIDGDARRELRIVCIGSSERRGALASQLGAALDPSARLRFTGSGLVTIEGGLPLMRRSRIRAALAALAWLIEGIEFADFSAWLRGPLSPLGPLDAAKLELWWRTRGPEECTAQAALAVLPSADGSGIAAARTLATTAERSLAQLPSVRSDARAWSEAFRRATEHLVPAAARDAGSEQHQEFARWIELLDELGSLRAVAGLIDAREALAALREVAARASWEPSADGALITLAADANDPLARYDAIRVCGLDAERWPAPPVSDPFIPVAALLDAKVPAASAEGQWRLARQQWQAWRRATPELALSAALAEGDQARDVSPLLAQVPRSAGARSLPSRDAWLPRRWRQSPVLESLEDPAGAAWDVARPLPGGVASLQLQNQCAFHAYAQLRLGAEELEERTPGIRPDERGRWLHRALELFWSRMKDQRSLKAAGEAGWSRLAREVVEHAIEAVPEASLVRMETLRRERQRLERVIALLAGLEQDRAPFEVIGIESPRELQLGRARFQLRIDRIDRLEDGSLAVLDYKSGKGERAGWHDDRPEPTQLFAYLASLGPEVSLVARIFATTPAPRYQGLSRLDGQAPGVKGAPDWEALTRAWTNHVTRLAAQFLEGRAAVDPARDACRYCHLAALCRIGELAEPIGEGGGD